MYTKRMSKEKAHFGTLQATFLECQNDDDEAASAAKG